MKHIFFIIILSFSLNSNAQVEVPIENYFSYNNSDNVYFKDVNHVFDKFLHTWEYTNGSHYFKITFYKHEQTQVGVTNTGENLRVFNQYTDRIYSHFIYKYNGVVVYDTYPQGGGLNTTDFSSFIDGENYVVVNNIQLYLNYREPSITGCDRILLGTIDLQHQYEGQNAQLVWVRTDRNIGLPPFGCPSGTTPDTSGFQIPANMVLTKVIN